MGAARRLQQEIDAVLKKVKEGISTFDDTYDKVCPAATIAGGSLCVVRIPSRYMKHNITAEFWRLECYANMFMKWHGCV